MSGDHGNSSGAETTRIRAGNCLTFLSMERDAAAPCPAGLIMGGEAAGCQWQKDPPGDRVYVSTSPNPMCPGCGCIPAAGRGTIATHTNSS